MEKQLYESPLTQVIDLMAEGVVCLSGGDTEQYTPGGNYGDDLFN